MALIVIDALITTRSVVRFRVRMVNKVESPFSLIVTLKIAGNGRQRYRILPAVRAREVLLIGQLSSESV